MTKQRMDCDETPGELETQECAELNAMNDGLESANTIIEATADTTECIEQLSSCQSMFGLLDLPPPVEEPGPEWSCPPTVSG